LLHKEQREFRAQLELKVLRVRPVPKAQWVRLVHRARRAQLALKVLRVRLVLRARRAQPAQPAP
jgi:hypothetical protein